MNLRPIFLLLTVLPSIGAAAPKTYVLTPRLHHLRVAGEREWSDFPRQPEGPSLTLPFRAHRNNGEWALRLRQQDLKQNWKVLLNGKELARLAPDENDQVVYLPVPAGAVGEGMNKLVIEQGGRVADDVRIGEITLESQPVARVLAEAAVEITVTEPGPSGKAVPVPCRITILNAQGALTTVGAASGKGLAVRPGVVYTGTGTARFGLPAGEYTLHAGRGFAYGIATVRISVRAGEIVRKALAICREVPTPGYVSCDTHVHTLTYSGHGDASADERVLTLAGEGIELPIITEHNRQIDYRAAALQQGVARYFTLVTGNEVTTAVGHFNIFPVKPGGPVPDFRGKDWKTVFAGIADRTGAPVVILNHPRDLHSGFRPFGPERHLALTGTRLDGWELRANAMEVINSGAQQSDVMRPVRDWFGLLNGGLILAPVGSSDSHDVSRYIVGQGRTYVRCRGSNPGNIDVPEAVESFRQGRVLVSCGLLAEIIVNDKYGPGDLVPAGGAVKVKVRVLGPGWATADRVALYANGSKVKEVRITEGKRPGVKWEGEWLLPRPRHDLFLAAVASGPGVRELYWPIAKPYQPTTSVVNRRVLGVTGAVRVDGDGDGRWTSARGYAERLFREAKGDWRKLVPALAAHDEAVAAQAAALLQAAGVAVQDPAVRDAARKAGAAVKRGFQAFAEAWRGSRIAQGFQP